MFDTSIFDLGGILVAIVSVFVAISASMTLSTAVKAVRAQTAVKNGYEAIADVVNIGQTGVTLNNVPMMRIELRVHHNGVSWEVAIEQFIDLGNLPRAGERARVMIDPTDNGRVKYVGLAGRAY
ncbi:hypothetical protein BTM_5930 (plasmid) [Burkholderia thailandensis 34]|nr:hypothetical protein BTM_5930 [Burkholderia thailandensis 34]